MTKTLPLNKANRIQIARAFKHVPRVDMSIDCVIEGQMGVAIADDDQKPVAIRLELGSFVYFAGDVASPGGRQLLETVSPYSFLMPSAPGWFEAAEEMYGERLLRIERYSFSSAHLSYQRLNELIGRATLSKEVKRMDLSFAERLWDQDHFVDLSAFDAPEDFVNRGIGYYMQEGDGVIGATYSSLVCGKGVEVSLYVPEEHRRLGIATLLSAHLLKWCLENNTHANWDAANQASCQLAEKLGYLPSGAYEAYYLKK